MKFDIKNLDKNIQRLPKKVIFCKKCTVSNQRPRITFNTMGVCSACEWSEEKHNLVNWKERERELKDLLDRFGVVMENTMLSFLAAEVKIVFWWHTS